MLGDVPQHARDPLDPRGTCDRKVRREQGSFAEVGIVILQFVLNNPPPKTLIHLLFDNRLKGLLLQYFIDAMPYDLLSLHLPVVQERAIRDYVTVVPVHYH